MGSLQDQLLKAGLVDKNKAQQAKKEKQKKANMVRKSGAKVDNKSKAAAQEQQRKRAARDLELNQQRQQESQRKEIAAQIKQLVDVNKLDRKKAEISYSYVFKNKVKNIYVTEEQKTHLTQGHLAIVTLVHTNNRHFEIVPMQVAQKIAERDAASVVQLNDKADTTDPSDDPYADYQIPDDLTW
jgi:uncharacterized protein YaiL (DUF2058 family)